MAYASPTTRRPLTALFWRRTDVIPSLVETTRSCVTYTQHTFVADALLIGLCYHNIYHKFSIILCLGLQTNYSPRLYLQI